MAREGAIPFVLCLLLAACGSQSAEDRVDALITELRSATGDSRKTDTIIVELAKIGEPAVPKLIALFPEEDRALNEAAAEALLRISAARPYLEASMLDRKADIQIRTGCALVLDKVRSPDSFDALLTAARDADFRLRPYAIRALGATGVPEAYEPLVEILRNGDRTDASAAAIGLGRLGDRRATQEFVSCIESKGNHAIYGIMVAFGILKDPESVPYLLTHVESKDDQVVVWAVYAIGNIAKAGDARAREALIKIMNDKNSRGALDAVLSFKEIATREDLEMLRKLAESASPLVAQQAQAAIARVEQLK